MDEMICWIDGAETEIDYIDSPTISTAYGYKYVLFENYLEAEKAVRDRWESMTVEGIVSLVGTEKIIDYWWRGISFKSFVDEIVAEGIEFQLAAYDGKKCEFESEHEELIQFTLAYQTE